MLWRRPSPQRVVLVPWLACPAAYAVARQPNRVYEDHRKSGDAERDKDAGSTEKVRNDRRHGERSKGLQQTAPQRCSLLEAPERHDPQGQEHRHHCYIDDH